MNTSHADRLRHLAALRGSGRPRLIADLYEAGIVLGRRSYSEWARDAGFYPGQLSNWFSVNPEQLKEPTLEVIQRLSAAAGLDLVVVNAKSAKAVRRYAKAIH